MVRQKIYETIHLPPWDSGRGPTVVPHGGRYITACVCTVVTATAVAPGDRGYNLFSKICNFFV
jgi:hypothetical protein